MLRKYIFRRIKSKYKHLYFLIFCADMNATMLKEILFIEAFSSRLAGIRGISIAGMTATYHMGTKHKKNGEVLTYFALSVQP